MDKHSYIIRIFRIVLPIAALVIVALVFFKDWNQDEDIVEQFNDNDRNFSGLNIAVEAPAISTLTANGDELEVTAKEVTRPEGQAETIFAEDVQGNMAVGGSDWDIRSDSGEGEPTSSIARFRGHVVALIDGEYDLRSDEMLADIANRSLSSPAPIDVKSKRFDLSADEGVMSGELGRRVVQLKGNIKGELRLGRSNEQKDEDNVSQN